MNIEDIKVGDTYNVRVKVLKKENGKHIITNTIDSDGWINSACTTTFLKEELSAFSPITPEPAPKYDPCRLFKKGDKVRVVEWNGRDIARVGEIGHVVSDEFNSRVELAIDGWTKDVFYPACHLELVTPVAVPEPYSVDECCFAQAVYVRKNEKTYMTIPYAHPVCLFKTEEEAKHAAEAECARLNAEYRKEQNHDK